MAPLVNEFVAELPGHVADIRHFGQRLGEEGGRAGLLRLVHQLKGAGGGYGLDVITAEARLLEQVLRNHDDAHATAQQIQRFVSILRSVDGYQPNAELRPAA